MDQLNKADALLVAKSLRLCKLPSVYIAEFIAINKAWGNVKKDDSVDFLEPMAVAQSTAQDCTMR